MPVYVHNLLSACTLNADPESKSALGSGLASIDDQKQGLIQSNPALTAGASSAEQLFAAPTVTRSNQALEAPSVGKDISTAPYMELKDASTDSKREYGATGGPTVNNIAGQSSADTSIEISERDQKKIPDLVNDAGSTAAGGVGTAIPAADIGSGTEAASLDSKAPPPFLTGYHKKVASAYIACVSVGDWHLY